MTVEVQVPAMGESITEATVASVVKSVGDMVSEDEVIAELETEKINLEVTAPAAGVLTALNFNEGDTVTVGDIMAVLDETASAGASAPKAEVKEEPKAAVSAPTSVSVPTTSSAPAVSAADLEDLAPAVRKLVEENKLNPADIKGTGKGGRIIKEDVLNFMASGSKPAASVAAASAATTSGQMISGASRTERREKMTALRKTIARRLKEAQNTAAMLTTFNEVDLTEVMAIRAKYKDQFKEQNGVGLGFMSFFAKAVIEALKAYPAINAEIDGEEIVYKDYYDIGVAVSSPRGLLVPVVRNVDQLTFAGVEQEIKNYAIKARDGKIMPSDMEGGTFTITNGGVFGSMMSTPILNAPQVGILGMHAITERPMVVNGEIKVRPMMYIALSYDHRIVDGSEAVSFLVKIKECLEDPARLMLNL